MKNAGRHPLSEVCLRALLRTLILLKRIKCFFMDNNAHSLYRQVKDGEELMQQQVLS